MTIFMRCRFLFVAALLLAGVGVCRAEEGGADAPARAPQADKAAPDANGRSVEYRMQDVEIRGELERPDIFYIIPRRAAKMDLGKQTISYGEAIMEPIDPAEFEAAHADRAK